MFFFCWAVTGHFIITTSGIFWVYIGTDKGNPKKVGKTVMCAEKKRMAREFRRHMFRISGETKFFHPCKLGV